MSCDRWVIIKVIKKEIENAHRLSMQFKVVIKIKQYTGTGCSTIKHVGSVSQSLPTTAACNNLHLI